MPFTGESISFVICLGVVRVRHKSTGTCRCKKVVFSIFLSNELEKYRAWKCDCDFCLDRNASYLSHPDGNLHIESPEPLNVIYQGSKQAAFLTCSSCGVLVAVVYQFNKKLKGAVNSSLLIESERLKYPIIVSPKLLTSEEKLRNWEKVWLSVTINGNNHL